MKLTIWLLRKWRGERAGIVRNNRPEKTCTHLVGEWQGCDEGGTFTDAEIRNYGKYAEEWFTFCPRCGKKLPPAPEK